MSNVKRQCGYFWVLKRQFLLGFVLLFCHLVIDMPCHLDLFLSSIFHSSVLEQGWCSGWLVPSCFSLSLLSGARGVMRRRKERRREVFLPFPFPSPPSSCHVRHVKMTGMSQVQWWCTCLPPMWPGFKSWHRSHMWVEFVVGSLPCSERFFTGLPAFPSPQNQHFHI